MKSRLGAQFRKLKSGPNTEIIRLQIKDIFCEQGVGAALKGSSIPPFPSRKVSFQEMVFWGAEGLDFQAKKWENQPQDFLSISFLIDRPPVTLERILGCKAHCWSHLGT